MNTMTAGDFASMVQDALRYRWLREHCVRDGDRIVWPVPRSVSDDGQALDQSIDEQIEAGKSAG